ncbi:hypothetical protein [Tropicimonas sediminicola]|uniref:Phosphoglycolate phosphatase n=1 Tax=Tropicimonas sediminicola TaxID=1031541 RepID=A0A239MHA6_9RHOB|nr:hypothetical protein [Tropicimonas sediminicola]SNT41512.1 phosphoglycolate phosphatase [Tropicimonas sediminicola]
MIRIFFDLDGAVIDKAPELHGVAYAMLADAGLGPLSPEAARSFIGRSAAAFVRQMRMARSIPVSGQAPLLQRLLRV